MACRKFLLAMSSLVMSATLASAAPQALPPRPGAGAPTVPGTGSPEALAANLRTLLLQNIPDPLYEASPNWGHTTRGRKLKFKGQGLRVHPAAVTVDKNDGTWRKIRFTALNPAHNLTLEVRNVQRPDEGRMLFDAYVSFDARVEFQQQIWESGIRLYSGSTRARMRVRALLQCEVTSRFEKSKGLIPDLVFRMRVVRSSLHYDNLVVEHIAGVGGEAARILGEALRDAMRQLHPSLERDLFEKANAAIVKAGDTKEIRVSVTSLLTGKGGIPSLPLNPTKPPKSN